MTDLCGCLNCTSYRAANADAQTMERFSGPGMESWRYACELCGNKRCPHHSDHTLACTRSNEPGQKGSVYT